MLNGEEDADEHNDNPEQSQILNENDMEGILNWHIVHESLVDVIKQLLCASSIIFPHLPLVSCLIEIDSRITLHLHLTCRQVRNRLEVVLIENGFVFFLVGVVNDGEEGGYLESVFSLSV